MKPLPFLLLLIPALGLAAQSGEEMAGIYVAHGLEQMAQGQLGNAEELFRNALEYDGINTDASAALGLILASRAPVDKALPYLETALAEDRFRNVKRSEAAAALGGLKLRLRDYGWIIRYFSTPSAKSPEEIRLLHLAYDLSGRKSEARAVLEQGMKLHPFWSGWLELALRYPDADPQLPARLRKDLRDTGGAGSLDLERAVRRLPEEPGLRKDTVALLLSLGYLSPGLIYEAVSFGLDVPETWKSRREPEWDWGRDYLALADVLSRNPPGLDSILSQKWKVYTGTAQWDDDRDGWADAFLEFQEGRLVRWSSDRDQNGVPEMEVHFSGDRVHRVSETAAHLSYEVVYEDYPFISSLKIHRPEEVQEFLFPAYQTPWPVVDRTEGREPVLEPRFWKWNRDPVTLESLIKKAALSLRRDLGGKLLSRSRLLDGEEYLREEDSDGDGRRDAVTEFSGGEASRMWKDLDGDGRPDMLVKSTVRGKVLWADTRGKDIYDFGISPEGWKIWDFNLDGEPDFRLLNLPGREVLKIMSYRGRSDALKSFPSWEALPWP